MGNLNFFSNLWRKNPEVEKISPEEKIKMGAKETVDKYSNKRDVDHELLSAVKEARSKYVSCNEQERQKDGTKTVLEILNGRFPDYEKSYIANLWEALDKKETELTEKK